MTAGGVKKKANPFAKKAANGALSSSKNVADEKEMLPKEEQKNVIVLIEQRDAVDAMDIDEPKDERRPIQLEEEDEKVKAEVHEEKPVTKQADIVSFFKKATVTKTDSTAKFATSIFLRDEKAKEERKAKELSREVLLLPLLFALLMSHGHFRRKK